MKKIGLIASIAALLLIAGCDALYDATNAKIEDDNAQVAQLTKLVAIVGYDLDGDPLFPETASYNFIINEANKEATLYLAAADFADIDNAFTEAWLDIYTANGGKASIGKEEAVDLTPVAGIDLVITSKDGSKTATYTVAIKEAQPLDLSTLEISNYNGASRHSGGVTVNTGNAAQMAAIVYANSPIDFAGADDGADSWNIFYSDATLSATGADVSIDLPAGATILPMVDQNVIFYLDLDDTGASQDDSQWNEAFFQGTNQKVDQLDPAAGTYTLKVDLGGSATTGEITSGNVYTVTLD